jgi:hypothetical protein
LAVRPQLGEVEPEVITVMCRKGTSCAGQGGSVVTASSLWSTKKRKGRATAAGADD